MAWLALLRPLTAAPPAAAHAAAGRYAAGRYAAGRYAEAHRTGGPPASRYARYTTRRKHRLARETHDGHSPQAEPRGDGEARCGCRRPRSSLICSTRPGRRGRAASGTGEPHATGRARELGLALDDALTAVDAFGVRGERVEIGPLGYDDWITGARPRRSPGSRCGWQKPSGC